MQPARMAQIRRDPASEVVSVSPRRDFRPTESWAPFAVSPIRRFGRAESEETGNPVRAAPVI